MNSLTSLPNQINSQPRQKRFSLLQKAQFLSFLTFRESEENPENLSNYANRHQVSRQALYNLKQKFSSLFSPQKTGPKIVNPPLKLDNSPSEKTLPPLPPFHRILGNTVKKLSSAQQHQLHQTLLEVSNSPLSAKKTRNILWRAFSLQISKTKIKALLSAYSKKAQDVLKNFHLQEYVEFIALDEIFCGGKPILVGVELNSFAVVLLEKTSTRDHKTWLSALEMFEFLEVVVSDEGSGLMKAVEEKGIAHQLDLFHFKREASKVLRHLESQAYKKIEEEYRCLKKYQKQKEKRVELLEKYEYEKIEALKSVELFDVVEKNVKKIFEGLEIFDEKGKLQEPSKSLYQIKKASERLKKASTNKKIVSIAEKAIDERLLRYLKEFNEKLQSIVLRWKGGAEKRGRMEVFEWIGNFFYEKSKVVKVYEKEGESRKLLIERRKKREEKQSHKKLWNSVKMNALKACLWNFEEVYQTVMKALGGIYRASSLVESYNSQIRVSQQVKKGVSQEYLWLSLLKWNMTPFEEGKRKGKSPLELLGVKLQTRDWLELLVQAE